ncbi:hypothetical protein [Flindersiella endophytica]
MTGRTLAEIGRGGQPWRASQPRIRLLSAIGTSYCIRCPAAGTST